MALHRTGIGTDIFIGIGTVTRTGTGICSKKLVLVLVLLSPADYSLDFGAFFWNSCSFMASPMLPCTFSLPWKNVVCPIFMILYLYLSAVFHDKSKITNMKNTAGKSATWKNAFCEFSFPVIKSTKSPSDIVNVTSGLAAKDDMHYFCKVIPDFSLNSIIFYFCYGDVSKRVEKSVPSFG